MKKTLVILNGFPRSGKDSFADFCIEHLTKQNVKAVKFSSVDKIKEASKLFGYDDNLKSDNEREFISKLKELTTDYFDHPFNYITNFIVENDYQIFFVMIREIDEIRRIVNHYDFTESTVDVRTVLIEGKNDLRLDNNSDKNVKKYVYDYTFENFKSLYDWSNVAIEFSNQFLKRAYKLVKLDSITGETEIIRFIFAKDYDDALNQSSLNDHPNHALIDVDIKKAINEQRTKIQNLNTSLEKENELLSFLIDNL